MKVRRTSLYTGLMMILLMLSLNQTPASEPNLSPDVVETGEIAGITYHYGQQVFSESGSISYTVNGTVQETYSNSRTGITDMPLITDFTFVDQYYVLTLKNSTAAANTSRDVWADQAGLESVITYLNTTVPLKFDPANATLGLGQMKINVTEGYKLVETSVVSETGEFLGAFPQNATFIEFLDLVDAEIIHRSILITPKIIVVNLITEVHQVFYNQTEVAVAFMGYINQYSMNYNITASAYQVSITDGENFGINVGMFDRIDAEYEETTVSLLFYSIFAAKFTELQFTEDGVSGNGTSVTDNGFGIPFSLLPVFATSQGTQIEAGYRHVSSSIVSTYQSIAAGFLTRANESRDDLNETSLSARLAVWGLSTSTTMVAFNDGNDNGRLDLAINNEGLYVKSEDQVEALGLAEAYETNVTNAYYRSHVYNESVQFPAQGVSVNNTNVNRTVFAYNTETYGFGDVNHNSENTFVWEDPVLREDGNVEFNFGMNYTNFPVTWVNVTDGSSVTDAEDIAYHYVVVVNPTTGQARISPTWIYGGISDPGLKQKAEGLSLALMVKSEFFGIQATYTATESDRPVNSTRTATFSRLAVRFGGADATEIDATGPKQFYTNNGTTHQANFDAIRIVTVAGSFSGERVSPFSSESETSASNAGTGSLVERLDVNFIYTADLLVVSYPTWSGGDIVHDPDYNMSYEPVQVDTTSDTGSDTSSTTSETSSSTTSESSTSETSSSTSEETSDDTSETTEPASTPGFGVIIGMIALIPTVYLYRKRT